MTRYSTEEEEQGPQLEEYLAEVALVKAAVTRVRVQLAKARQKQWWSSTRVGSFTLHRT